MKERRREQRGEPSGASGLNWVLGGWPSAPQTCTPAPRCLCTHPTHRLLIPVLGSGLGRGDQQQTGDKLMALPPGSHVQVQKQIFREIESKVHHRLHGGEEGREGVGSAGILQQVPRPWGGEKE